MAVGHFPLFRLGTLLARQLSAPIARRIKIYARAHPRFGRWVCMRTGRAFHECELRFRMWTLALRQPRALPSISDETALNSGADILGEIVIFALGGLIVTFEVNRQATNQEEKELNEQSQWLAMLLQLEELQRELVLQQQDIDRLHAVLRRLASQYDPQAAPIPAPLVPTPTPHAPIVAPSPKQLPTCEEPPPPPTCEEAPHPPTCEEAPHPPTCEELSSPPTVNEPSPPPTCEERPPPPTCKETPPPPPTSPPSPPPCPELPPPLSEPPCQCQQLVKPKC